MDNIRNIKHLYARAGFGIRFDELQKYKGLPIKKVVGKLLKDSEKVDPLAPITENIDIAHPGPQTNEVKKMVQEQHFNDEKALNSTWIKRLSESNAQLLEKMTLFWHNHFACNVRSPYYTQVLINIQRTNALGNFKTMLLQVSQSTAMLQFLNNQQNLKGHPNENFARELMELYTLGRGHYTEQDIKESARAFTGWVYNNMATFAFNPKLHDDGVKTFMGRTGNFRGEDIIDTILANKQTAIFLSTKLYRYFVNDVPDDAHISQMADVFYKSNYEIKPLVEFIFNASWFYEEKNIGNLIKSPVELLTGLNRQFYISYENPEVMMQFQRTLGQLLFHAPNVAGWPGGKTWIDSSLLMYRLKIPSTILNAGLIDFVGKADPDEQAYLATVRKQQLNVIKRVQSKPDWDKFLNEIPKGTSKTQIAEFILEPSLNKTIIDEFNTAPDMKACITQIVSTLEYQLC